jgi:hypothetical protein
MAKWWVLFRFVLLSCVCVCVCVCVLCVCQCVSACVYVCVVEGRNELWQLATDISYCGVDVVLASALQDAGGGASQLCCPLTRVLLAYTFPPTPTHPHTHAL